MAGIVGVQTDPGALKMESQQVPGRLKVRFQAMAFSVEKMEQGEDDVCVLEKVTVFPRASRRDLPQKVP